MIDQLMRIRFALKCTLVVLLCSQHFEDNFTRQLDLDPFAGVAWSINGQHTEKSAYMWLHESSQISSCNSVMQRKRDMIGAFGQKQPGQNFPDNFEHIYLDLRKRSISMRTGSMIVALNEDAYDRR